MNLSRRKLTDGEFALLSKGLNFFPTPTNLDRFKLCKDINEFIRRIRLKEYFYEDKVGEKFSNFPGFRRKSIWSPERGREIAIEAYAQAVEEEILSSLNNGRSVYGNLSSLERKALKDLKSYEDLIIKEADKGSGVVVMDRDT